MRAHLFRAYVALLLALGLVMWSWIFSSIYGAMRP
jgi:hypothetical protein